MEQIQSSRGGPVGVGGSASRVFGARGVSPVDGSTTLASPRQLRRALTVALLKSFKSIGSGVGGNRSGRPPTVADSGGVRRANGPSRVLIVFLVFFKGLCAISLGYSCPLYSSRMYLYVYTSLYGIFMVNACTFDKKN